jgi:predicted PurR-regulated permease PerM
MRNKVTKKKVIRIITPLLVTAALAAIVLLLVKDFVQYKEIYDDVAAWSAFFSVFGIVYAIVAGFLLVTVLSKYSDLSQVIENELNAIETVRDFLTYLGDEQEKVKTSIKSALSHYTSSLLDTEWPEMSDPRNPWIRTRLKNYTR